MQKETVFGLIGIIAIIILSLFYYNSYEIQANTLKNLPNRTGNTSNATAGGPQVTLTAAEIAKHSTAQDCWMIVNNRVYDASGFDNLHPGGASNIIFYCGKDATIAFASIRNGRGHSAVADMEHAGMLLGDLNSQIAGNLNTSVKNITNIPKNGGNEFGDR